MKTKLTDTNSHVSKEGRADIYAKTHPLKQRHSADVVGGADSGIDQFAIVKKYKLKGLEYGNWVSNNDRYDHLLAAQRSLKHLAKIIGSDNIGFNEHIGIAFGARGRGGKAAAHYEPCMNMINLTKPSGAGCLAHEYGHAIDYNFGSFVDQHKAHAALSGGWHTSQTLPDNVGGQLRAMTNELLDKLIQTESHQKLRKIADEYWIRRTEVFARFFEQYICYKMRKISTDKYLNFSWSYYTHSKAYWTEKDFMTIIPLADKLCKELSKFFNGQGKLVITPYHSAGKLTPLPKKQQKPAKVAAKTSEKEVANLTQKEKYRKHLTTITEGLIDLAKNIGKKWKSENELLTECYNFKDLEYHTANVWKRKGATIKKGEFSYLLWGKTLKNGKKDIVEVYTREQVVFSKNK